MKDILAHALSLCDLDLTVKVIQDALGIKIGDIAGQHFNTNDRLKYSQFTTADSRAEFIRSWLVDELLDAAYRVDGERLR